MPLQKIVVSILTQEIIDAAQSNTITQGEDDGFCLVYSPKGKLLTYRNDGRPIVIPVGPDLDRARRWLQENCLLRGSQSNSSEGEDPAAPAGDITVYDLCLQYVELKREEGKAQGTLADYSAMASALLESRWGRILAKDFGCSDAWNCINL